MVNSIELIREKNELNRKMDGRHEHGFHFTKEEPQMEIGKSTIYVCVPTHQVYVLNVINNQRTANKNKKVTPFTPIFVFPHPGKKKNVTPFHPTRTGKYLKGLKMSSIGENLEPQKLSYNG